MQGKYGLWFLKIGFIHFLSIAAHNKLRLKVHEFEVSGALRFRFEAKKIGPYLPPTSSLYPPTAEGSASNLKLMNLVPLIARNQQPVARCQWAPCTVVHCPYCANVYLASFRCRQANVSHCAARDAEFNALKPGIMEMVKTTVDPQFIELTSRSGICRIVFRVLVCHLSVTFTRTGSVTSLATNGILSQYPSGYSVRGDGISSYRRPSS